MVEKLYGDLLKIYFNFKWCQFWPFVVLKLNVIQFLDTFSRWQDENKSQHDMKNLSEKILGYPGVDIRSQVCCDRLQPTNLPHCIKIWQGFFYFLLDFVIQFWRSVTQLEDTLVNPYDLVSRLSREIKYLIVVQYCCSTIQTVTAPWAVKNILLCFFPKRNLYSAFWRRFYSRSSYGRVNIISHLLWWPEW